MSKLWYKIIYEAEVIDLDDIKVCRQLDASGMLEHLHRMPEQCQQVWQKADKFALPDDYTLASSVVVLGMGGSAIGGDMVSRLALIGGGTPVYVHRDYGLPPGVDAETLVVVSSYSGNTEETLDAFNIVLHTPAQKLVLTSGGRLKELAESKGLPLFLIDYSAPPRAAFMHSFIPLVTILGKLGVFSCGESEISEAGAVLSQVASQVDERSPLASNLAKQLATKLKGRIAVIYGADFLSGVARRWKTQLNENSKNWAFYELFPELNHNAVVGYEFPPEVKERILVVLLRSGLFHPRILTRYDLTASIMSQTGISYEWVEAQGVGTLAQMMSLVLWGDYVSFYLALLNQTDPTPIPTIDYLKRHRAHSL